MSLVLPKAMYDNAIQFPTLERILFHPERYNIVSDQAREDLELLLEYIADREDVYGSGAATAAKFVLSMEGRVPRFYAFKMGDFYKWDSEHQAAFKRIVAAM